MHVAELFVDGLTVYGLAGLVFAVAFVTMGIQRVDSVAEHAPLGFRLDRAAWGRGTLAPAAGALVEGCAEDYISMIQPLRRAHFRIWVVLALLLYAVLLAGLLARRTTTPPNPTLHWERLP